MLINLSIFFASALPRNTRKNLAPQKKCSQLIVSDVMAL